MPRDVTWLLAANSLGELRRAAVDLELEPVLESTMAGEVYDGIDDPVIDDLFYELGDLFDISLGSFLSQGDHLFTGKHLRKTRRLLLDVAARFLLRSLHRDASTSNVGPTGDALESWAAENGVAKELDRGANELALHGFWIFGRRTVRELLNAGGSSREALRAASDAWRHLQARADENRRGLEEEASLDLMSRPLPPEAPLARLVERLREVRAEIRKSQRPRPHDLYQALEWMLADTIPLRFQYLERGLELGSPLVQVQIPLVLDGPPEPLCLQCKTACVHWISAIDHLLAVLHGLSEEDRIRSDILGLIVKQPWERTLSSLEQAIEALENGSGDEGARVWWSIDELARQIAPNLQTRGKKGKLLKPKRTPVWRVPESALIEPRDREIHALVRAMERHDFSQRKRVFAEALRALVGHPRVLIEQTGSDPWQVERARPELAVVQVEGGLELRPVVAGRAATFEAFHARLAAARIDDDALLEVDREQRVVRVVDLTRELMDVFARLERLDSTIPEASHTALLERLARLSSHLPIRFPDSVQRRRMDPKLDLILVIVPLDADCLELSVRVRPIEGGVLFAPGEGPLLAVASTPDRDLVSAERDLNAEIASAEALLSRLGLARRPGWIACTAGPEESLDLLEALRAERSVECQWPKGAWVARSIEKLNVEVIDRPDWFGVASRVQVDDHRIDLAVLLDAARSGRRFVKVDERLFLRLERSLFERLARVEPLTFARKGQLQISPAAAGLLSELGEVEAPVAWRELEARIEAAGRLDPKVPPSLRAELRPYQIEGHAWLTRLAAWGAGVILADDMGLGKTIQTIAVLIDRAQLGPQLVVAPTSVCFNWVRELERFAPALRPIAYAGADRRRLAAGAGEGLVLITSYALLQRDLESFAGRRFATLVIDEAQAIKNANTKRAQALRSVEAEWTVALTGTPVENRLSELWSIFRIVFPGLLGSWEHFRERFATPIERDRSPEAIAELSQVIRPFVVRRTKAQVAKDLPDRTEITIDVALSPKERELYEDARLSALAHLSKMEIALPAEQVRFHVLAALTRLRQICCHPQLYDPLSSVPSSKLECLLHIVADLLAEGRRALVFSQFTASLALVRKALDELDVPYLYLDGQTPAAERGALIDRFQRKDAPIFLLSLKAGGTGLNLTAADTVIHLDPWWNPAVEDQATDRAHRIGQTQPVTIYRLVARGTIEEQIVELHEKKRGLIGDVLDGTDRAGALGSEELIALVRAGAGSSMFEDVEAPR